MVKISVTSVRSGVSNPACKGDLRSGAVANRTYRAITSGVPNPACKEDIMFFSVLRLSAF